MSSNSVVVLVKFVVSGHATATDRHESTQQNHNNNNNNKNNTFFLLTQSTHLLYYYYYYYYYSYLRPLKSHYSFVVGKIMMGGDGDVGKQFDAM